MKIPKMNYLRLLAMMLIVVVVLSMRGLENSSQYGQAFRKGSEQLSTFTYSFVNHNDKFRVRLYEPFERLYYVISNFTLYSVSPTNNSISVYRQQDFLGDFNCTVKPGTYFFEIHFVNLTNDVRMVFSHYGWTPNITLTYIFVGVVGVPLLILEILTRFQFKEQ